MKFEKLGALRDKLRNENYGIQWQLISEYLIEEALGTAWMEKNLSLDAPRTAPLNQKLDQFARDLDHHMTCTRLGHMLYLLKDSPGFDKLLADAATRDFEPVFFEMYAAALLKENGYPVRFVSPTGQKGQDYDLQVEVGGTLAAVEVKTRRNGLVKDVTTLSNTLKKAKKQLPDDIPSIICIALSTEYLDSGRHAEEEIEKVIDAFLRGTKQISGVLAFWNSWQGNPLQCLTPLKEYRNSDARTHLCHSWLISPKVASGAQATQNGFPSFLL